MSDNSFPLDDELLDWYNERPKIIQEAILKLPPNKFYKFKDSGKQCYIVSYEEPENENNPVTVTVQKTGVGGVMAEIGLGSLDQNRVFGVSLENLEPYE